MNLPFSMSCIHGIFAAVVLRPRVWATSCPTCKAGTAKKSPEAEYAKAEPKDQNLKGYPLSALGRRMGPMDPNDTRDLWKDGN